MRGIYPDPDDACGELLFVMGLVVEGRDDDIVVQSDLSNGT